MCRVSEAKAAFDEACVVYWRLVFTPIGRNRPIRKIRIAGDLLLLARDKWINAAWEEWGHEQVGRTEIRGQAVFQPEASFRYALPIRAGHAFSAQSWVGTLYHRGLQGQYAFGADAFSENPV